MLTTIRTKISLLILILVVGCSPAASTATSSEVSPTVTAPAPIPTETQISIENESEQSHDVDSEPAAPAEAAEDPASHPGAVPSPMVGTVYLQAEPGAPVELVPFAATKARAPSTPEPQFVNPNVASVKPPTMTEQVGVSWVRAEIEVSTSRGDETQHYLECMNCGYRFKSCMEDHMEAVDDEEWQRFVNESVPLSPTPR